MTEKPIDPKFWEVPEKKQCRGPDESQMSS